MFKAIYKKRVGFFYFFFLFLFFFSGFLGISHSAREVEDPAEETTPSKPLSHQDYLDYFEKVYETMEKNYYLPVLRDRYNSFIKRFDAKIFSELNDAGKSNNYIKWRSAAFLVDELKSSDDIFSALYPPKPAKKYEQTALGKRVDIGIEGKLGPAGYQVSQVEPRSDSYKKGLRVQDSILKINQHDVLSSTEKDVEAWLNPLEGETVEIVFLSFQENLEKTIQVISEEYFKQTIFLVPVPVKGVYCLQMQRFNRKTFEDMFNYLTYIQKQGDDIGLILDLRGNPGGPPLAAREIAAFFLTPGEDFAYFQKRGYDKSMLDVPRIPAQYYYSKPIVILVNKESGSASELFTGVMQHRKRAVVMGTNSAGQVFLKSMFNLDDESMVLLVTGRGYYPDGSIFSFNGVEPDRMMADAQEEELLRAAAAYLVSTAAPKG
ncbi:MAG: hypothetical protein A3D10_07090 [Omnitrophica WOR_2 bacterium RIFCSPHIGHO2_02_FULL_48_11]|nr:MAG: hypothetical protein A3D10_07090 [Omnitrophica WOR_2 bacterium RIFCSPHIGHO2_02_FULL_48_11]